MTYHTDPGERAGLITGLLDLAIFLEANPDVPTPFGADVLVFPPDGTNAEIRAEIDAIAARIGGQAHTTVSGHYTVSRWFGPVEYRAVAIPRDNDTEEE
jgi:hypothetical protein